ncbi:MAG: hypothetical protein IH961_09210 [Chloroflexi bacterium]|nr:hypothetical protein [Chloroflexota bacterium]
MIAKAGALWFERGDGEAATATLNTAQSILEVTPDERATTGLLATRSAISDFDTRDVVLARLKDAEDAVNLSAVSSDPAMEMRAHTFVMVLKYMLGRMDESKSSGTKLVEVSRRFGIPSYGKSGIAFGAWANMARGEWESIGVVCDRLDEQSVAAFPIALRMTVNAIRGIDSDYEESITRMLAEEWSFSRGSAGLIGITVAQVQLMHPEFTLEQNLWDQIDELAPKSFSGRYAIIGTAAIIAVVDHDQAAARAIYEKARGRKGLYWILSVDRLLGLLSRVMGELDQAEGHFEDAIQFLRENQITVDLAWTCSDHAELLIERDAPGDREKATELQDEAITIAQELGMNPLLERVLAQREILKA